MRSTLSLAIVVTALLGLILWNSTSAQVVGPPGHPAWEYKVHILGGVPQDFQLNKFGDEGWELVTITTEQAGDSSTVTHSVFKRVKQ